MIKVTVLAGEGKFTELNHNQTFFKIKDGALHLMSRNYVTSVVYAPGSWLKVEYAD